MAVKGTVKIGGLDIQQPTTNGWPPGTPAGQQHFTSFTADGGVLQIPSSKASSIKFKNTMQAFAEFRVNIATPNNLATNVELTGDFAFFVPMTYPGTTSITGESFFTLSVSDASGFASLNSTVRLQDSATLNFDLDRTKGPLPDHFTIPMDIESSPATNPRNTSVHLVYTGNGNDTLTVSIGDHLAKYAGTLRAWGVNIFVNGAATRATLAPQTPPANRVCDYSISGRGQFGTLGSSGLPMSQHDLVGARLIPGIPGSEGTPATAGVLHFSGNAEVRGAAEWVFDLGNGADKTSSMISFGGVVRTSVPIKLTVTGGLVGQYTVAQVVLFQSAMLPADQLFTVSGDRGDLSYTWQSVGEGDVINIIVTIAPKAQPPTGNRKSTVTESPATEERDNGR
ncbi:hypothetical protein V6765_03535 [Martelella sp. FOR1707]